MSSDELAFIRVQLDRLADLALVYPLDTVTPPAAKPRKPHPIEVELAPPPSITDPSSSSSSSSGPSTSTSHPLTTLTIKSLKPPHFALPLPCSPLDPISDLKASLHTAHPHLVPPPAFQRLLVKGKALADGVLLREYGLQEGTTVVLAFKPGFTLAPSPSPAAPPEQADPTTPPAPAVIPSLTLSDPDSSKPHALPASAFASAAASSSGGHPSSSSVLPPTEQAYHATVASPAFWVDLLAFAQAHFGAQQLSSSAGEAGEKPTAPAASASASASAETFWEAVLAGQKKVLRESEVARIRDEVGLSGMGGVGV